MRVYNVLKRMIERGQAATMREDLALLLLTKAITQDQYRELTAMLDACRPDNAGAE